MSDIMNDAECESLPSPMLKPPRPSMHLISATTTRPPITNHRPVVAAPLSQDPRRGRRWRPVAGRSEPLGPHPGSRYGFVLDNNTDILSSYGSGRRIQALLKTLKTRYTYGPFLAGGSHPG